MKAKIITKKTALSSTFAVHALKIGLTVNIATLLFKEEAFSIPFNDYKNLKYDYNV